MTKKEKSEIIKSFRLKSEIDIPTISSALMINEKTYIQYEDGIISIPKDHLDMIGSYLKIDPYLIDLKKENNRQEVTSFKSLFKYDSQIDQNLIPKNKLFFKLIIDGFRFKKHNNTIQTLEAEIFHPETIEQIKPHLFVKVFLTLSLMAIVAGLTDDIITINLILSSIPPLTILVLLHEFDRSRQIKGYKLLKYFFYGGFLSITMTYFFRGIVGYPNIIFVEDLLTGFVEETAKIIIVLIILKKLRIQHVYQGILIGFAVGAGFDTFETTSYGLQVFLDPTTTFYDMHLNILYRGMFAFIGIGHHYWTAILAGTFIAVNRFDKLDVRNIKNPVFLLSYALVILTHALWNFTSNEDFIFLTPVVVIFSLFMFIGFIKVQYMNDFYIKNDMNC